MQGEPDHGKEFAEIVLHLIELDSQFLEELAANHQPLNLRRPMALWGIACDTKDPQLKQELQPRVENRLLDYIQTVFHSAEKIALGHPQASDFVQESLRLRAVTQQMLKEKIDETSKKPQKNLGFEEQHGSQDSIRGIHRKNTSQSIN